MLNARDQYGVEPDYVSFNEPDVGACVGIASFEMVMLIEQTGPRFDEVIRQLGEQLSSGSVIVETSNNSEELFSVAAQVPDHFAIFMVNTSEQVLIVNLERMPDGIYSHIQTTETELETIIGTYQVPDEPVVIQIPGMSIQVLSTRHL